MRSFVTFALLASVFGCTPKVDEPACNFEGRYRLEYREQRRDRPFRFDVDSSNKRAMLVQPTSFAVDEPELELDPDRHACKLTVVARTQKGDYMASLTLDPKTQEVTGTYRTVGDRKGVPITGVRDKPGKTAASPRACVKPGVYELVVPKRQPWTPGTTERSCADAAARIPFAIDFVGDKLAVHQIAEDVDPAYVTDTVEELELCRVSVFAQRIDSTAQFELTFKAGVATVTPTLLDIYIGEPGDRWQCTATDAVATIERTADVVPPSSWSRRQAKK